MLRLPYNNLLIVNNTLFAVVKISMAVEHKVMSDIGKFLMLAGLAMAIIGALLWSGFGKNWLGRLPGDIHYSKGDFHFAFPIVTCLILSAVLTLVLCLFRK